MKLIPKCWTYQIFDLAVYYLDHQSTAGELSCNIYLEKKKGVDIKATDNIFILPEPKPIVKSKRDHQKSIKINLSLFKGAEEIYLKYFGQKF